MKAFIITLPDNVESAYGATKCLESIKKFDCDLEAEYFTATTPHTLSDIKWSWPLRKKSTCPHTGLLLTAYKNADIKKRLACAESHYRLWKLCLEINEEILVLEHDAIFVRKFLPFKHSYDAISLNDPRKATFKGNDYDGALVEGINDVPLVTDQNVPQGLPGHSAYLITPAGATTAIEAQDNIGWWPNDAIMCKQIMPNIGCVKPYYTKIQNIKSSTVY